MSAQHTPGPWYLEPKGPGFYIQAAKENGDPFNVAILNALPADARVMAAAPDLADALRDVIDWMDTMVDRKNLAAGWLKIEGAARAALAKLGRVVTDPPPVKPTASIVSVTLEPGVIAHQWAKVYEPVPGVARCRTSGERTDNDDAGQVFIDVADPDCLDSITDYLDGDARVKCYTVKDVCPL